MLLAVGGAVATTRPMLVRYFSKKRSVDVRRINPKVPKEEAKLISKGIYELIKQHGPITVSDTWNLIKESCVGGLNSKTHMKLMLKWMRGREMLRLFCRHQGTSKRFFHCTLPEESQPGPAVQESSSTPVPKSSKKEKHKKEYKRLLEPKAN